MAPLTHADEQALIQRVLDQLAGSPYACTTLSRLSGGTANFLYRGTLLRPLLDVVDAAGAGTVIVKVSTEFAAINRDFPLDVMRCLFEECMLRALAGSPRTISNIPRGGGNVLAVRVRAPELYSFYQEIQTQVLQDFPGMTDLTTVLESPSVDAALPGSSPTSVGHAMGSWLRMFHTWASEPDQSALVAQVGPNQGMRRLKCFITYDSFIEILQRHPEVIQDIHMDALRDVQAAMKHEFERPPTEPDDVRGLIHGDFWGGK